MTVMSFAVSLSSYTQTLCSSYLGSNGLIGSSADKELMEMVKHYIYSLGLQKDLGGILGVVGLFWCCFGF